MVHSPSAGKEPTRTERVVASIRRDILWGAFAPGERLVETALAEHHQVARSTVREALQRLASMGYAIGEPHKGFVVREFTHDDVVGLGEVFALLEIRALQSVRFPLPAASLSVMRGAAEQMAELTFPDDLDRFAELDRVFHGCLVAASGRPWLLDAWRRQGALLSVMTVPLLGVDVSGGRKQRGRHLELLDRVVAGDRLGLRRAIREHYHQVD